MFTPEFLIEDRGEFVLVASHNLESDEAVLLSVSYNKARVAYGLTHAPSQMKCRLVYDIRGQNVSDIALAQVNAVLKGQCNLEFKR